MIIIGVLLVIIGAYKIFGFKQADKLASSIKNIDREEKAEKKEIEKFQILSKKAICFVLFISIPMIAYFFVYARQVVLLLSGEQYKRINTILGL